MDNLQKYYLKRILVSIFIWIIALRIFILIRFWGYDSGTIIDVMPKTLLLFRHNWYLTTLVGLLMGLIYGLMEHYVFNTKWKHVQFPRLILARVIVYMSSLVIVTVLILFIYNILMKGASAMEAFSEIDTLVFDENYMIVGLYGLLISILLFYFSQINKKLGDGEFRNIITGKYHFPKEEYRVFMFLDLEGSTPIAEKLGHVKFSQLMQDTFAEISRFVIMHNAAVYQHVGDEIVLTWKKPVPYDNILGLFFDYEEYLAKNSFRYLKKYGIVPKFRASVNEGKVTTSQIGYTKQEIAYHGDVLIVAARMQKLCKRYDADILISENCIPVIRQSGKYSVKRIDSIVLKGRSSYTSMYTVSGNNRSARERVRELVK